MRGVVADLQHALQLYIKTPAASAVAILVLAAAMAAVTAFLSLWSDLALKPHPGFERAQGLVTIGQTDGRALMGLSLTILERINEEVAAIDSIAGVMTTQQYYDRNGAREPLLTELVTSRYFPDVRPRLALGRPLGADDHDRIAAPAVVLSYAFWQQEYGGRPDVLGERLKLYGPNMVIRTPAGEARAAEKFQDYEIVGVMAPELAGTFQPGVSAWMAYEQAAQVFMGDAGDGYVAFPQLLSVARLAPGVSVDAARNEVEGRYHDAGREVGILQEQSLYAIRGVVANLNTYRETLRQVRLFLAGSVLLALVAAANVSLFLLSRAPGRQRELSIRMAVGAPLKRLARQLATEAGLLVVIGTLLGLLASLWLAVALRGLAFLERAQWRNVTLFDWRVLGLVAGLVLLLTLLVSLAPIMGLRRLGIAAGSRTVTARAGPAQRIAASAQLVAAAVIGAVALAFVWYLAILAVTDRGFDATNVYAVALQPPERGLPPPNPAGQDALLAEREHRRAVVSALPGVEAVAFSTSIPGASQINLMMQLAPIDDPQDRFAVRVQTADAAYFDLLGATLLDGRGLEGAEPTSVIVNETLARRVWGRTDVTGEVVPMSAPPGATPPRQEVVGVVKDIAYGHPRDDPEPMMFMSMSGLAAFEAILVKTTLSIADLQRELQTKIDDGTLEIRIQSIRSVRELADQALAPDRARTWLTVGAAALVAVLAGFGYYGTQRFAVTAGRREYAILAALGAGPRALGRLVLRRGFLLGVPGLIVGSVLAFGVVAWMRDDFFSRAISPAAVAIAAAACIALLVVVATLGPARQARRTDPAPLLREE